MRQLLFVVAVLLVLFPWVATGVHARVNYFDQYKPFNSTSTTFSHASNVFVILIANSQMNTIGYKPTVNGVSMNVLSNPNPTSGCAVYYLYVANAETNVIVSLGDSGPAPAHIVLALVVGKSSSAYWSGLTSTTSNPQSLSVAAVTAGDMILSIATAVASSRGSPPSQVTYTDGPNQTRIAYCDGTGDKEDDTPTYYNAATVVSYQLASTTQTITETASARGSGMIMVGLALHIPSGQRLEQQNQLSQAPLSLPVGSYWSGNGIVHRSLNGTGSYAGNLTMDVNYSYKFTVTNRETNSIMLEVEYSETQSRTATGAWVKQNGGSSTQNSVTSVKAYYTIDLTTMKISDVSSNQAQSLGYLTYFFIDPQTLRQGGDTSGDWYGSVVPFYVGPSRNVTVDGADVEAWSVMHSGDWYGYWHVGNNPSTGTETHTILYDKTHGVVVGWDLVGSYVYSSGDGSWTETDFDYFRVTDSNFIQTRSTAQPNLIIGVSATIILIVVASLIIQRRKFGRCIVRLRQVIQPLFKKHKIQSNKQEMSEEHDEA